MKSKLLIGILGSGKSGKTYTWDRLFSHPVKTGRRNRKLYLSEREYVNTFLISRSPGKRKIPVEKIIGSASAEVILCSLQYDRSVIKTMKYFHNAGFQMYLIWLNPGFNDDAEIPLFLDQGIINQILQWDSTISVRNGKSDPGERVSEIRQFIYGWAKFRGLLQESRRTTTLPVYEITAPV